MVELFYSSNAINKIVLYGFSKMNCNVVLLSVSAVASLDASAESVPDSELEAVKRKLRECYALITSQENSMCLEM